MGPAPKLIPISQCNTELRFEGGPHWPRSLPAVAINGIVIAGFDQSLVFNHVLNFAETETILGLFLSLYPRMSAPEAQRFSENARVFKWIPVDLLNEKWSAHPARRAPRTEALQTIRDWLERNLRPALPRS